MRTLGPQKHRVVPSQGLRLSGAVPLPREVTCSVSSTRMGTSLGTLSYLPVSKQNAISMGAPETLGIFGSNSHSCSEPGSGQRWTWQPDFYLLPTGPAKCRMRFLGPSGRLPGSIQGMRRAEMAGLAHRTQTSPEPPPLLTDTRCRPLLLDVSLWKQLPCPPVPPPTSFQLSLLTFPFPATLLFLYLSQFFLFIFHDG